MTDLGCGGLGREARKEVEWTVILGHLQSARIVVYI